MPCKNAVYQAGYEYAKTLQLDSLPLAFLIDAIGVFTSLVRSSKSQYDLGLVKGMEEEVLRREESAA